MKNTRCTAKIRAGALIEQTDQAYYWLGFLMADGSVSKTTNEIKLKLQISDLCHIRSFCEYLGLPLERCRKYDTEALISFSSAAVKSYLMRQGITAQKTYNASVKSRDLLRSRFFWAGYFDGDGTIGKHSPNEGQMNFFFGAVSGSEVLMKQFANFLHQCIGFEPTVSSVLKKSKNYNIRLGGKKAARVAQLLYCDNPYALARKVQIAVEMVAHYGSTLEGPLINWKTETGEPFIWFEKKQNVKHKRFRVNGPNEFYVGSFSNLQRAVEARDLFFKLLDQNHTLVEAKVRVNSDFKEYFPKSYSARGNKIRYDQKRRVYYSRLYYQTGSFGQKGSDIYIFEHEDCNLVQAVNDIAHKLREVGYVYEGRRKRLKSDKFIINHSIPKDWKDRLYSGGINQAKIEKLGQSLTLASINQAMPE